MKHEKKKDKTFSQKEPVTKSSHNKEREINQMKENILFTKYLAEEMSIPLTVLYNIIKQHKTTFKDNTSFSLLMKQITKLRNIHQNISKIENLDKKLESPQPEKIISFKKMYWDLILNYNELYQKSNVDFIHNYYGSYEYGITQFQKEIEIVIKNLLEFSYLRTNIVEKTYFSFKLENSSLVVKINMVFNKAKKTENHQIKKLSSNYNQINAIANKINGRIQIEKNSNQSQTLMFSLPVQVYSDIKNEFSSEYFTKIKKDSPARIKSPIVFIDNHKDKFKMLKMGVKNRFNLVQLRHYNQFIKNISITAPQTIIIDFTSEINIKIKMLNALKNTEITRNIPVLGIIDNDDLQVEQMVLVEGINMILKNPFSINQLENYLNNLCNSHSMSTPSQSQNKNDFPRIPNTLIELLNKTIEEQIKLGDLSNQAITKKVGMNYKSLNLKIKILTDQTLAAYVLNYRLEKAKKLLASDLLIKEICYDCGFDDSANFNRAFKRKFDKSPAKFRSDLKTAS